MSQNFERLINHTVYEAILKREHIDLLNYLIGFPNTTVYLYYKLKKNDYINKKKPLILPYVEFLIISLNIAL